MMYHDKSCSGTLAWFLLAAWIVVSSSFAESVPPEYLDALKSEEFKEREAAQARMLEWSKKDVKVRAHVILELAREAPDPEVRQRSHNVLYDLAMVDYLQEGEGFVGIQMIAAKAQVPGEENNPRELIAITRVLRDTPAREAGLRVGDMIASVNGVKPVADDALPSFQKMIRELKPGVQTRFEIIRDGELIEVDLVLGRRPPEQQARFFNQPLQDVNELEKQDQDRFFREWLQKLEN